MSDHKCKYCDRAFGQSNNMYRHIKQSCKVYRLVNENGMTLEEAKRSADAENDKQNKNTCHRCNKSFSCYSSLRRHVNSYCIVIREELREKQKIYDELVSEMENMREKLSEYSDIETRVNELEKENMLLKKEPISINNGAIHYGNGNINTMNVTVNVVPFGKEDISKIDKNDLLQVFRSGFNSALRLTETTHFNPKYPEYHNVYISNMKNKYAMTFDGADWALVMKDELIDKMYDNKRDYIEENMDEFYNSLLPSQINALHRWLNVDDDHQYVQKVKNEMKLMLYNKRKMALDPKPVEITDIEEPCLSIKVIKESKHDNNVSKIIKHKRTAPRNGRYRKVMVRRKNNN